MTNATVDRFRTNATVDRFSKRDLRDWCYKIELTAETEEDGKLLAALLNKILDDRRGLARYLLGDEPATPPAPA